MDSNNKSKIKTYKIGVMICITAIILSSAYFAFYKYQLSKLKPPVGFSVEVNTKDLKEAGVRWWEAYIEQYLGEYVPRKNKIIDYCVANTEIKEPNVF
jgi:hypothetical protein